MNNETQSIIRNLQNVLTGEPWYGRAVFKILEEIDSAHLYKKLTENSSASVSVRKK